MIDYRLSRREFLARGATLGLTAAGLSVFSMPTVLKAMTKTAVTQRPDLAVAAGGDPATNTLKAVQALGGMERFVKKDAKVAVKPNPATASSPEIASTTNPAVVKTIVGLCMQAGAREVVVLSHDTLRNFEGCGIMDATTEAGGRVVAAVSRDLYRTVPVVRGRLLQNVAIANDILDADVFINVPIAKHHVQSELTLAMKNLMGINWNRLYLHQHGLHQGIADLSTVVKQDLIVMDATRLLLTNGPGGPGETRDDRTVIAGTDPVAVDAYTATLFDRQPSEIRYIRYAYELGVGEIDLERLKIEEIAVN